MVGWMLVYDWLGDGQWLVGRWDMVGWMLGYDWLGDEILIDWMMRCYWLASWIWLVYFGLCSIRKHLGLISVPPLIF